MILKNILLIALIGFSAFIHADCLNSFLNATQTQKIQLSNQQEIYVASFSIGNQNAIPRLVIKNKLCDLIGEVKIDNQDKEGFLGSSFLYFKTYSISGLPKPIIVAVVAMPGGSDTEFVTKVITVDKNKVELLNDDVWHTLIEGGLYIGYLSDKKVINAVVWNMVWGDESHVDPHRYEIKIYDWNGKKFVFSKKLFTKNKYDSGESALKEFNINVKDMLFADFNQLNQYR